MTTAYGRALGAIGLTWLATFGAACAVVPATPGARLRDAAVTHGAGRECTVVSPAARPASAGIEGMVQRARSGATRESARAHAEAVLFSDRTRPSRASHSIDFTGRSGAVLAARADTSPTH